MNNIKKAIEDLKKGKLVVVLDDFDRENEGDLIGLVDFITDKEINFMITEGRGILCAPISVDIAKKHNIKIMDQEDYDGTNFAETIDAMSNTTGVSTIERLKTFKELTSKESIKFKKPGHVFPLIAKEKGLSQRRGHTEAAIDLAKLCDANQVGIIVEITSPSGEMMRRDELIKFAKKHDLELITIDELVKYISSNASSIWEVKDLYQELKFSNIATLPNEGNKKVNIQQVVDISTGQEGTLYWRGDIKKTTSLRSHSQCLTSEVFGSLKCDCKKQLDFYKQKVLNEDNFLLIYTFDEGRGINLFNKINAYHEQDKGLDTLDANIKIGFPVENRDFNFVPKILSFLGIKKVDFYTNNPMKIKGLEDKKILVNRKSIWLESNPHSENYINSKIDKMGHIKQ